MTRAGHAVATALLLGVACSQARTGSSGEPAAQAAPPQNLVLTPTAATVGSGRAVQVEYTLADAQGRPLAGVTDVAASWTLAVVRPAPGTGTPEWQSLVTAHVKGALGETDQPATDPGGQVEDLGGGRYRYTYGTALPDGYDASATYRAGVFARRPIAGQTGANDIANGVLDFVPAGGAPQPYDAVATQACNRCHGILQAHGGFRRDVRLCLTCHTTQLVDPDTHDTGDPAALNPLDLARLVHRIHRGEDLPTVQAAAAAGDRGWSYHVIGFRGSDNVYGATAANPNTAAGQPAVVATGVAFPRPLTDCTACHAPTTDAQGQATEGAQAGAWSTAPSIRACQACHDDVGFTAAQGAALYHAPHAGGLLDDDPALEQKCGQCHGVGTGELDVPATHVSTTASLAFQLLQFRITGVTAAAGGPAVAGQPVRVAFQVLDPAGAPIGDLAGFQGQSGRLAVTIAGPTVEYTGASVVTKTVPTATSATGDYTLDLDFPQGVTPTGTWAAAIEGRRKNTTLSPASGPAVYDFGRNPVAYFAIGGGAAQPRRQVVATSQCETCHGVLSAHGSLRHDVEYCVMCHAPDATDAGQRAAAQQAGKPILDGLAARSIHFKSLVHSLHTGEDLQLQRPFVIYGFGGNPAFLDEVRFPGTTARCSMCHQGTSWTVESVPATAAPTQSVQVTAATLDAQGAVTSPGQTGTLRPVAAACLSCHDNPQAQAHVAGMEASAGSSGPRENCYACHGQGGDQSVALEHGRFAR